MQLIPCHQTQRPHCTQKTENIPGHHTGQKEPERNKRLSIFLLHFTPPGMFLFPVSKRIKPRFPFFHSWGGIHAEQDILKMGHPLRVAIEAALQCLDSEAQADIRFSRRSFCFVSFHISYFVSKVVVFKIAFNIVGLHSFESVLVAPLFVAFRFCRLLQSRAEARTQLREELHQRRGVCSLKGRIPMLPAS
jgi:hypothetical protein